MRIIMVLAAAAALLALPLAGAGEAHADGNRASKAHHAKRYAGKSHRHAYRRARRPQVAGFRFRGGGHPSIEYEPYVRYNDGNYGYYPTWDNRNFEQTVMGGGIRLGGERP